MSAPEFKACVLIPTYDNPKTVRHTVERVRRFTSDVIVVDDGSGPEGEAACAALARDGLAHVDRRATNGGKGAAVKRGFEVALARGYTHAVQVDADGQHDLDAIPTFLTTGRDNPTALVLGSPVYDETIPSHRLWARRITAFWVALEVGRGVIEDAMIGFRVYPLEASVAARARGDRMDFDIEIAVRLAWTEAPVINLPVRVTYPTAEDGGVSHFQPWKDNLRFFWLHCRLCTTRCFRAVTGLFGRLLGRGRR